MVEAQLKFQSVLTRDRYSEEHSSAFGKYLFVELYACDVDGQILGLMSMGTV